MKKEVKISELRKVAVEYSSDVNVWDVLNEAHELYKAVKLVGLENVTTTYFDNDETVREKTGKDISKRVRALAAYIMLHRLQMRDSSSSIGRLQTHFGGISIEASVGYRLGVDSISLTSYSILEIIEKYVGSAQGLRKEKDDRLWLTSLYELVVKNSRYVDPFALWYECESLFETIVTVGLENTTVTIDTYESGNITFRERETSFKGKEIPERIRAFALFAVVHMYRLREDEDYLKDLQRRFGIGYSVRTVLGDTDIFKDRSDNLKCISLCEIVGRYFKEERKRRIVTSAMYFQAPYDAIEMKKLDTNVTKNIYDLWAALDSFYKACKIVGVDNVLVKYTDANKDATTVVGRKVAPRIRAFTEEAVLYMYRMNDSEGSRTRLERHLGLEYPSRYILGNTKVVCSSNNISMPCVSLKELVEEL